MGKNAHALVQYSKCKFTVGSGYMYLFGMMFSHKLSPFHIQQHLKLYLQHDKPGMPEI